MAKAQIGEFVGEVVDLFCGVGALSHGFLKAGFDVRAGYDIDANCRYAFETNNKSKFIEADVAKLSADEIRTNFSGKLPTVVAGCAPCQPFSTYKQRYSTDPQWLLVPRFAEIASEVRPDYVTMENVPRLLDYGNVFNTFVKTLEAAGYLVWYDIIDCSEYAVPQRRRRLVVVASLTRKISGLHKTRGAPKTVRDAIGTLPPIEAGESDEKDRLHVSSSLSPLNLKRIKHSTPGGTWRDWPKTLIAECHQRDSGKTYPSVYGRMKWDEPAPTITTQSFGFGNGRFGHPQQNRGISLREAAILQSFPKGYRFIQSSEKVRFKEVGRWIGNAVPVKLGQAIAKTIASHLRNNQ